MNDGSIIISPDKTVNGNYAVQETLLPGWEDITSMENWDALHGVVDKDYKYARTEIMTLAWAKMRGDPANWDDLSAAEKSVAARWFVVPKQMRDTVYTTAQQIPMAEVFDTMSIASRRTRFAKAKYEIYNRLTVEQANVIINEIERSASAITPNLRDQYIEYGRVGTPEGDPEGLFDYVVSQAGTSFENAGFSSHDYVPEGYASMSAFAVKIMDIVKNGNY